MKDFEAYESDYYDIAIIGGGVIGSLIAYKLSKYNLRICLIEMTSDLANGASGANSAIVHTGYDPKPNSKKATFNREGFLEMKEICEKLGVPFVNNGAMVLSFSEEEDITLNDLLERGKENGVKKLEIIPKSRVLELEPNISEKVRSALYVPGSSIICPYELTFAAAETAFVNGVEFKFEHEVIDITSPEISQSECFEISCKTFSQDVEIKKIRSEFLINAAGVNTDKISEMAGAEEYKIIPRRGEYIVFDKILSGYVKHTLFPAPTDKGKGILVTPTVDGNILIGPNAIGVDDRYDVSTTKEGIEQILKMGLKTVPGIDRYKIIRTFSGIRATPSTGDFIIGESAIVKKFFQVGGIESPGLTSSPAIAKAIEDEFVNKYSNSLTIKKSFIDTRKPSVRFRELTDSQKQKLIKKNPKYASIICRCENVTQAEIEQAIHRPLGARSVNGVKMRTRAGMGRCQSGFCLPKIVPILADKLGITMEDVKLYGYGSEILKGNKR